MDHLTPGQVEALGRKLAEERDRLIASVDDEERTAEADDHLGDIEDKASEEHRRTTARLRQGHHSARIAEIKEALLRIEEGTYGICEETGEPIPVGRLNLQPATRYTVEALELLEAENARAKLTGDDDSDAVY